MKKILLALMLCMVSISGFGQISSNVTKVEKKSEWLGFCYDSNSSIYHYFNNSSRGESFYLVIRSSNEFEKKKIYIKLGNDETETIESLNNLYVIFCNNKDEGFYVDGTVCDVFDSYIFFKNPENTVGKYYIKASEFNKLAESYKNEYKINGKFLTPKI